MQLFQRILVVVDASRSDSHELQRAINLASQTDAALHVVDVVKDANLTLRLLSRDYTHIHELLLKEKREQIQKLVDQCTARGIKASGEVLEGVSSQQTLAVAKKFGADLIIRATKGAGSRQAGNLGTSAQKLVQQAPCATWLADSEHEPNCKTIVAAVDASPDDTAHNKLNHRILDIARQLATQEKCRLLTCYVWNLYGSDMLRHRLPASEFEALLELNRQQHIDGFEKLLAEFGMHANEPTSKMLEGEPSSAIPELCQTEQADLLICGTVARHGISDLLLGNTAARIVNRVDCSVLAITPEK